MQLVHFVNSENERIIPVKDDEIYKMKELQKKTIITNCEFFKNIGYLKSCKMIIHSEDQTQDNRKQSKLNSNVVFNSGLLSILMNINKTNDDDIVIIGTQGFLDKCYNIVYLIQNRFPTITSIHI